MTKWTRCVLILLILFEKLAEGSAQFMQRGHGMHKYAFSFFSPTVANCGVIRWFWWFVKKTSFEILGSINLRILISISGMISYWALAFVTDLSWSARTRMRWGRWCFDGNLVSYWIRAIDIESEQLCNIATSYTASKQQSSYWSARCPLLGS